MGAQYQQAIGPEKGGGARDASQVLGVFDLVERDEEGGGRQGSEGIEEVVEREHRQLAALKNHALMMTVANEIAQLMHAAFNGLDPVRACHMHNLLQPWR